MNARTRMRHRCTVERDMAVRNDPWGHKVTPNWKEHLINQPCYAWFDSQTVVEDGDKVADVAVRKMVFPLGTDITIDDRVALVTNRLGTEQIFTGPGRVRSVGRRPDHVAVTLEDVS